jgi:hypothetical protein
MRLLSSPVTFASVLHCFWAGMLMFSAVPLMTTPLSTLDRAFGGRFVLSAIFMTVSTLALHGATKPRTRAGLACMLPQWALLLTSAWGGILAAWMGMYADGVPRPTAFILADQFPIILAAALYGPAILVWHLSDPQ